jgi:ATP-dependent DNA helicase RecQ
MGSAARAPGVDVCTRPVYTPSVIPETEILEALRRYWGYSSFRPLQHNIVRSLLANRDACVVMPTGGGKSLCYQLPAALLAGKTAIVISPLIALMQDQVAQLAQMGIEAAALNSMLKEREQTEVIRKAQAGRYRLLYVSPERLARADTLDWLDSVPISCFVIDEAHCISEWGHEFRPDYRHLNRLRERFPERPIAAFTASATRRVRHDIIEQLQLREPDKYIASFHRPNLSYLVQECNAQTQPALLLQALRKHAGGNIIIYSPTIARVEQTVDFLAERGIRAVPYHGRMDAVARSANQERWMSDEVRVLVGTIAFGLGINKAAVRAVIHLSLPKSIEQYYQEAGRAGRDGHPSDCLLLWQKRDAALLAHFIKEIADPAERERAWQRYHEIRRFAESGACRHRQICSHFGETPKWKSCGACDACSGVPDWLAAPATPVRRKRGKSASSAARSARASQPAAIVAGAVTDAHTELQEYLREWRRTTAKQRGVPAYVVMHDTTLDELCRAQPKSLSALLRVPGFGERKLDLYGQQILEALERFHKGVRAAAAAQPASKPAEETLRLLAEGRTLPEIAAIRGRQISTVTAMVADMIEAGKLDLQPGWVGREQRLKIEAACAKLGLTRLRAVKDALPSETTFDDIRLVVADLRRQKNQGPAREDR